MKGGLMERHPIRLVFCTHAKGNQRTFSRLVIRMISISLLLLAMVSCTHNVPLSETLPFQNLPEEKIDKNVLVVMDKEFENEEVTVQPIALGDSFKFAIGNRVKNNLMYIMTTTFNQVKFANSVPIQIDNFDYVLVAKLVEFNPVLGRTYFSDHHFYLKIDYHFINARNEKLFTVNSVSGGEDEMSSQEISLNFVSPLLGMQGYRNSMARGCDEALASSMNQFIIKLDDYLKKENLIQANILHYLFSWR
jgi:hypothetical protein